MESKLPPSGRHFPTGFWGPQFWRTLHVASINYRATEKNKKAWKSLLKDWMPCALPCENCRKHYVRKMPSFNYSKILQSRRTLIQFLFLLHNQINKEVARARNRPFKPFTWRQFLNMYS